MNLSGIRKTVSRVQQEGFRAVGLKQIDTHLGLHSWIHSSVTLHAHMRKQNLLYLRSLGCLPSRCNSLPKMNAPNRGTDDWGMDNPISLQGFSTGLKACC